MKKLLVLMLSVGVISQLSVTSLSASSQVPNGATLASQLAVVQSAYNTYTTAYNNLYAYAISSGSTYKKNIKAALVALENASTILTPINSLTLSTLNTPSAISSVNGILRQFSSMSTPISNVVSASSNASYQKYAKSGNSNASAAGLALANAFGNLGSALYSLYELQTANNFLQSAIVNVLMSLYPQYSSTMSLSPFAPSAANYAVGATAPSGDFLPLSAANGYNQGQIFVSFLGTYADQQWYQSLVVSLILYTLLDNTIGVTVPTLMYAQRVFGGVVNGTNGSPLASSQMSAYISNSVGLKFTGGAIPAAALNLLINVSKANWSAIYSDSTQIAALVNAFNAINLSSNQFTSVFSEQSLAYGTYYVNAFKALQSSTNLYMNCSINPSNGQPSDNVSVYYAANPSAVTSDLATEFLNVQVAVGATAATAAPLSLAGINNMPFSYKTGTFYYMLALLSATDASNIWNSVCSKSSSSVWFNTPQIRQIISSVMTQNNATTSNLRMLK